MISPTSGYGAMNDYYMRAGFNDNAQPIKNVPTSNNKSQIADSNKAQGTSGTGSLGLKGKFVTGEQARIEKLLETYDEKTLKRMGIVECTTCASRTYVDGSNDPGVSFKTPQHVSPAQSVQAVISHEMEHVGRERTAAEQEGGKVLSQSVSIHMSTCPECGRSYSSGGVTRTTVSIPNKQAVESGQLVDMQL